jgi:hypothetical protein
MPPDSCPSSCFLNCRRSRLCCFSRFVVFDLYDLLDREILGHRFSGKLTCGSFISEKLLVLGQVIIKHERCLDFCLAGIEFGIIVIIAVCAVFVITVSYEVARTGIK